MTGVELTGHRADHAEPCGGGQDWALSPDPIPNGAGA